MQCGALGERSHLVLAILFEVLKRGVVVSARCSPDEEELVSGCNVIRHSSWALCVVASETANTYLYMARMMSFV